MISFGLDRGSEQAMYCTDVNVDRREHIYTRNEEETRMSPNQPGPGAKVRNMYSYACR